MIIITGASRGIGEFLFNTYSESEEVKGIYLNTPPAAKLDKFSRVDLTDNKEVELFVQQHEAELKDITLINCAGITYNSFAHKSGDGQWKKVIDVNLIGTFNMIKAVLPLMRTQKFGRIINFSSVVAVKPTPGISAYAASKSALWGLSRTIAVENAALNITVNNINLGYSELGMIEMVPEDFKKAILSQIPSGILCPPADILNTVNYLRNTQYITGSSIDLNGGLT